MTTKGNTMIRTLDLDTLDLKTGSHKPTDAEMCIMDWLRADGRFRKGTPIEIRLYARAVRSDSGCLEFAGSRSGDGYGTIRCGRSMAKAHRVSYQISVGPIPGGLDVCHRCDNPPCIEPAHLFLGTHAENNRDRHQKGRSRGLFRSDPSHPATLRKGQAHWQAKLSDGDVTEIRRLRSAGVLQREIADKFQINTATVSRISRGVWR